MRQSIVFFILGLMVLAKAEVNVFAQIDASSFGSTLLNLVQMNMQSNSQAEIKSEESMASISDLLTDLKNGVVKNMAAELLTHNNFQEKVANDVALFTQIVNEQQSRLTSTEAQISSDKSALEANKADYQRALAHLSDVKSQIVQSDEANKLAIRNYDNKVTQLTAAIESCKDANSELSKLSFGFFAEGQTLNMVQIKSGMEKIQLALSQHLPNRLTIYKPIISALVDMGVKSDPALVKKVQGLITQLKNALQGELSLQAKNEKVRLAQYNQLKTDLLNDARNTQERIGRDIAVGRTLKKNILSGTQISSQLKLALADSTKLLANRKQEAAFELSAYNASYVVNQEELTILSNLIVYLKENLPQMFNSYLQKRIKLGA